MLQIATKRVAKLLCRQLFLITSWYTTVVTTILLCDRNRSFLTCKTVLGCQQCTNTWIYPKCRSDRANVETYKLNGLNDFITGIAFGGSLIPRPFFGDEAILEGAPEEEEDGENSGLGTIW